jgi:hypothetical protein
MTEEEIEKRLTEAGISILPASKHDYSNDELRQLLPPSACKECIGFFRHNIGRPPNAFYWEGHGYCTRCNLPKRMILFKLFKLTYPRLNNAKDEKE